MAMFDDQSQQGGLLGFMSTPAGQGLLSAVATGLATARRGRPLNNIGSGLLGGVQGYQQAQDNQQQQAFNQTRQKLLNSQVAENDLQAKLRQQALDQQQAQRNYLGGVGKVTSPRLDAQPNKFDPMTALSLGMSPEMVKTVAEAPNLGRKKVVRTLKGVGQDGKEYEYQVDEFGDRIGDGLAQYRAPIMQDLGGNVAALDPYSLNPVSKFGKTMTPDAIASNAVARGNLSVAQQRLEFDKGGGVDGGGANQAGLIKQFGKPPSGFRWRSDGSMEFIPGGPSDQKAQLQKTGEGTVASVVAELRDKYNLLDNENSVVSQGNLPGTNFGAWLGNTGVGQTFGGMVGTKAQNARDSIAMTRPLLLQSIMKATGMSSKQMDSNAELKMYLSTATDPKLGLQANMEALDRIERLYGGGPQTQAPAPSKPQQSGAPKQGSVVDGYVFRGGDPSDPHNWAKVK